MVQTHLMKLLVFAHIPPPHHGQSYMVKLMLDRLGGDARKRSPGSAPARSGIECYHVDSRYSDDLEDIGSFRVVKAWLAVRYCLEALWCRFRYGADVFYYVPAPGKRAPLYRDWIVMLLCRPFFRHFIHHWHAGGLGDWLEHGALWWERWLTHSLLSKASLSIALSIPGMRDALWFRTQRVETVANGIPDPCTDFDTVLLPQRQARLAARRAALCANPSESSGPKVVKLLYLAHCTRTKGLFDSLEAVAIASADLARRGIPLRFEFTVAGAFFNDAEEVDFKARIAAPDLREIVTYVGFVSGAKKDELLRQSDFLCFPTYYEAEAQPVNLIEGMAFGLAAVTTRWRGIPDLLPSEYPALVATQSPASAAAALLELLDQDHAHTLRQHFLANYTAERHTEALGKAILGVDQRALLSEQAA